MASASDTARTLASGGAPRGEDARGRLLDAAIRVYAQHGYQGATTRAIAAEAGVNEVTLFRIFGSKESLLDEATARIATPGEATRLPATPRDPARELAAWFRAEAARIGSAREVMRKCFAEAEEHPRHVRRAALTVDAAAEELRGYVARLVKAGIATATPRRRETAVTMLLSTLVTDALGRDALGAIFRGGDDAPLRYARNFLEAIGRE